MLEASREVRKEELSEESMGLNIVRKAAGLEEVAVREGEGGEVREEEGREVREGEGGDVKEGEEGEPTEDGSRVDRRVRTGWEEGIEDKGVRDRSGRGKKLNSLNKIQLARLSMTR